MKKREKDENALFLAKNEKKFAKLLQIQKLCLPLHSQNRNGKSYTASSLRILQGLTAAKVAGCSGAI